MNIGSDGTELPDPSLKATEGQEDSCARNTARAAFAQRSIKTLLIPGRFSLPISARFYFFLQPNKP